MTLKFYMIRRGLTFDKLTEKSGASNAADVLNYAKKQGVVPTKQDEEEVELYFTQKTQVTSPESEVTLDSSNSDVATSEMRKKKSKKQRNGDV